MSEKELEDFFAAARRPEVPDGLMERVLAEGQALQPALRPAGAPIPSAGFSLAAVLEAIGGWRGASGLSAAMVAGLWIGFADAGGVVTALQGGEQIELLPEAGDFLNGSEDV